MSQRSPVKRIDAAHKGPLVVFGVTLIGLIVGWVTSQITNDDELAIAVAVVSAVGVFLLYSYLSYGRDRSSSS